MTIDNVIPLILGGWKCLICACDQETEDRFALIRQMLLDFTHDLTDPGRVDGCVILSSDKRIREARFPLPLTENQQEMWQEFLGILEERHHQDRAERKFNSAAQDQYANPAVFGWPFPARRDPFFPGDSAGNHHPIQFSALVVRDFEDRFDLKVYKHLMILATWWNVQRQGVCLHSAAVARGMDGFLFLGPSGAGKSTVAQVSPTAERESLGDELNFVLRDGEAIWRLAAVPAPRLTFERYSSRRPLLRGIFKLVQDDRDFLVPLAPRQAAITLLNGLKQTPTGRGLSNDLFTTAFQMLCTMAREVPGYELHFRKSSDFWKVIDAEFGS